MLTFQPRSIILNVARMSNASSVLSHDQILLNFFKIKIFQKLTILLKNRLSNRA